MLRHTFVHLPEIGPHREQHLWQRGILDWAAFLAAVADGALTEEVYRRAAPRVQQSCQAWDAHDLDFFREALPSQEVWRFYSEWAEQALFLDIETTGLSSQYHEVTLIGAYSGGQTALFLNGVNLHQFPAFAARFPLLVTFNGSQFDVPFLRARLPEARLDQLHIDLRFVLRSLGYRGGLKAIERQLGLQRDPAIQNVDGFEAVRLWYRYRRGDREALTKLVLYNLTDVVNLVELMERAFARKFAALGFPGPCPRTPPDAWPHFDRTQAAACVAELLASPRSPTGVQ